MNGQPRKPAEALLVITFALIACAFPNAISAGDFNQDPTSRSMTIAEYIKAKDGPEYVKSYIDYLIDVKLAPKESDSPEVALRHKKLQHFLSDLETDKDLAGKLGDFFAEIHKSEEGDTLDVKKALLAFIDQEFPAYCAAHEQSQNK